MGSRGGMESSAEDKEEPEVSGPQADYRTGVQREVDKLVEKRLTEVLTSAGVNFNRVAIEILYMLPRTFVEAYAEAFTRALGSADGKTSDRGKMQEKAAKLGRAQTRAGAGASAKAGQKRYKSHFVIKDEKALDVKVRADKRLRTLARDMRLGLAGATDEGEARARCGGCSGFVAKDWRFCASCGHDLMKDGD